jgi:hypothetical protein
MSNKKKWFIIIPFVTFIAYKIGSFPVYIDEATTYLEYSSLGFWTTLTTYNEPNNHVFFSLLTALTLKTPIDPLISMRLTNLVFSIICLSLLYDFLRKKFSEASTLIGFIFFVSNYAFMFYSIFARGYLLIILFTLLSFILIDKIQNKYSIQTYIYFGIITFLGFFTIPIYLYVSLSMSIIILIQFIRNKKKILMFILIYFLSGIIVFLLYLPIIYYNGIKSITQNEYTKSKTFSEIIEFLKSSWFGFYDKIFGVKSGFIFLAFVVISLFHLIRKQSNRQIDVNLFVFLMLPFFAVLIQKVIPGYRTWTYILVPLTISLTSYIERYKNLFSEKSNKIVIIFLVLIIPLIQIRTFNKSNPNSGHPNDIEANKIATFLFSISEKNNLFFLDGSKDYDAVIYLFERERERKGKQNKIYFNDNYSNQPKNTILISKNEISNSNKIILIKKFKNKLIYKIVQ